MGLSLILFWHIPFRPLPASAGTSLVGPLSAFR